MISWIITYLILISISSLELTILIQILPPDRLAQAWYTFLDILLQKVTNYSVKIGNQLQINSHKALAFQLFTLFTRFIHIYSSSSHDIFIGWALSFFTTSSLDERCRLSGLEFCPLSVYDQQTDTRVLTSLRDWLKTDCTPQPFLADTEELMQFRSSWPKE